MVNILHFILIGFPLLIFGRPQVPPVHTLDTLYPVHSLDHVLRVYPDASDNLTLQQLLESPPDDFLKGDELPRLLQIGVTYWGMLKIKAQQPLEGWTLHLEDKMIGPPAWTKSNGKVDVWAFADQQLVWHQRTGAEYAEHQKAYQGNWVLNTVYLKDLPVNTELTLILKVQGNSMGYPSYFNLTARSPDQPFYHEFNQFNASFNLFMFGLTFIVFLYHLLQFFYSKDSIFLWFSVWLLFCTLTQAMSVGLLIGKLSDYKYAIWSLIANGIFYSFWFFGRAFIDSKTKFPKLDKIILALVLFLLLEILITVFYVILAKPQTYMTGVGYHYVFLNIYAIFSLIVSIVLVFKKDLFARYFGIGSVLASICLIIGTLWSMGLILPPFKMDPYATGIFLQIVLYSFGIAYRRQTLAKQAEQEKLAAERSNAEMLRMKDLDALKTRFFTNISHEFRTPLTLIMGPLQQAAASSDNNGTIALSPKDFDIVRRNSKRLRSLVDELLELSKVESGTSKLHLVKGDILGLVRALVHSFESMAEQSYIAFETFFPKKGSGAYYDQEKLEKIISNLLSNAFKYTPEGGTVKVEVRLVDGELQMAISDTGPGIAKEDLPHVFDRFYRVEGSEQKGSGIGLALAKELVELHKGTIDVTSTLGSGTEFHLCLPITLEKLPEHPIVEPTGTDRITPSDVVNAAKNDLEERQDKEADLPLALIVEDNADLSSYINGILDKHYKVLLASDGEAGIHLAVEHIPDIIVTDVMMPKKDGFELCEYLRKDGKTSHIPIVMLTAKAGQQNKLQGLREGADAYLTKPFDADELLIRMSNLIVVRERLWQKLVETDGVVVDSLQLNSVDDMFLQKVLKTINGHLDDTTFTVEQLSRAVGFSRGQLHRKLKALLNKSPNQLITEVRLKTALQMLQRKTGNVSEVAYAVGYSNLSYFSKSFRQQFGHAPSEVKLVKL